MGYMGVSVCLSVFRVCIFVIKYDVMLKVGT